MLPIHITETFFLFFLAGDRSSFEAKTPTLSAESTVEMELMTLRFVEKGATYLSNM